MKITICIAAILMGVITIMACSDNIKQKSDDTLNGCQLNIEQTTEVSQDNESNDLYGGWRDRKHHRHFFFHRNKK